jgi:hypothetical protein
MRCIPAMMMNASAATTDGEKRVPERRLNSFDVVVIRRTLKSLITARPGRRDRRPLWQFGEPAVNELVRRDAEKIR